MWRIFVTAFAVAVVAGWVPRELQAQGPKLMLRLSNIGFPQTILQPQGSNIFDNSVFVPAYVNTVSITLSGSTRGFNGASTLLKCEWRDVLCENSSFFINGTPFQGWSTVHHLPNLITVGGEPSGESGGGGSDFSSTFSKTWCVSIPSSASALLARIQLFLATSGADESGDPALPAQVFIQNGAVEVSVAKLAGGSPGCTFIP
jgi:hypothetical protein